MSVLNALNTPVNTFLTLSAPSSERMSLLVKFLNCSESFASFWPDSGLKTDAHASFIGLIKDPAAIERFFNPEIISSRPLIISF